MHGSRGTAEALPLHSIQAKTEKAYLGEPAGWVSHHIINFSGTDRCNTSGACFSDSAPQLFYLRRDLPTLLVSFRPGSGHTPSRSY